MKCRVLKKGDKYYAQYLTNSLFPNGNVPKAKAVWKNLKNKIFDQRDGSYEVDNFPTVAAAERSLKDYASKKSEGKVVKEFEL